MAEKKDLYKFTIQFNAADPGHEQVAALLNQQGRRKAQFLVNAVLHYVHCTETPDIPQAPPMDTQLIESIVLRILKERAGTPSPPMAEKERSATAPAAAPEEFCFNESADALGQEGLAAIANTMALFRKDAGGGGYP